MASPAFLLLGSGYTLTRLGAALGRARIVLTSRRMNQVERWRSYGYHAEQVDSSSRRDIETALQRYPSLSAVVDSVPPPRGPSSKDLRECAIQRGKLFKERAITRVLYLSTTGVFGVEDGSTVNESTPSNPRNPLAEARFATEAGYQESGVNVTVVRIPAIYGPGRGLGIALQHGSMKLIEDGERWTNRVHVEDLVGFLSSMLSAADLPALLCVGDAKPALQKEVVRFYAERFQLPMPGTISVEQARAAGLYTQLANQRIDSSRARSLLGLALKFPSYREGAGSEFEPDVDPLTSP